jgi:N-acetyl-gamma-glutamyl-phosphate reductase
VTQTVFIDGAAGTTGLEIADRLGGRSEFSLIILDDARRKDSAARKDALHAADFAVLCLHDDAAIEAVAMAEGSKVRIIDASTAHRVAPGWTYGFPEIVGREAVANAPASPIPAAIPRVYRSDRAAGARRSAARRLPLHRQCGFGLFGRRQGLIERFEPTPTSPSAPMVWRWATSMCPK